MNTIIIDEKIRDEIQVKDYEASSLKELLSFMWTKKPVDYDAIDYYTKQYAQAFAEFETAKSAMISGYNINSTSWALDYATCILSYEEVTNETK